LTLSLGASAGRKISVSTLRASAGSFSSPVERPASLAAAARRRRRKSITPAALVAPTPMAAPLRVRSPMLPIAFCAAFTTTLALIALVTVLRVPFAVLVAALNLALFFSVLPVFRASVRAMWSSP
jgi:hypothetical protein